MTSAKEEFNNQEDRITHSVNSQPHYLVIPVFPNEPMKKVLMLIEMEILHGVELYLSRMISLFLLLRAKSANSRDNTKPPIWLHFPELPDNNLETS